MLLQDSRLSAVLEVYGELTKQLSSPHRKRLPKTRGWYGNSTATGSHGLSTTSLQLPQLTSAVRRHKALEAQPNAAHYSLAALSRAMPAFQTLSQNVDGLSQRADHPRDQLQLLHGTLFNVKCSQRNCNYIVEDFTDPIVPALAIPTETDPTSNASRELDISSPDVELPKIPASSLPQCPKCEKGLLRPGVVWFGEALPKDVIQNVEDFLSEGEGVDLIMVVGTSAKVYPAAGYIEEARDRGARVCVVNMDAGDKPPGGWAEGDWLFQGDAATILPQLLRPVIGDVKGGRA